MTAPPEPGRIVRPGGGGQPTGWMGGLSGLDSFRHYEIAWLHHDVFAGLALTAVLVPVGIAYAVASGVPAICGPHATIFGLLAYAAFGPSRVLVLGPDSSLIALVLGVVLPLSAGVPQRAMALAGMMALVSGSLCVLAGAARLGFVTELLSKPIRHGYMNGIALTVLISQPPPLFGLSVGGNGILTLAQAFVRAVLAGEANGTSLAIGAGALAVMGVFKGSRRFPGVSLAVAGATVVASVLDLPTRAGVAVLGRCHRVCRHSHGPPWRQGTSCSCCWEALRWHWFRSPTRVFSLERTPRGQEPSSMPIRRWSGWARRTSPEGSSRAFRSAQARHARRSQRPLAPEPNWRASWVRSPWLRCCCSLRRCSRTCPGLPWPRW